MRRIPPYIDCILQYYLMETYGQVACTARTRGTIGGHRRHATFFTPSSEGASRSEGVGLHQHPPIPPVFERTDQADGDLRSGRVLGEDARHDRGRYRRHDPGTIDFGGVRK